MQKKIPQNFLLSLLVLHCRTVQVVHGSGYQVLHHVLDELLHRGILTVVDIPRDGDKGLNRGLQDKGLW